MRPVKTGKFGKTFHAELNDYLTPKNANVIESDMRRYARANYFLQKLRKCSDSLTILQYKELRQMALDGKLTAAKDKLEEYMGKAVI